MSLWRPKRLAVFVSLPFPIWCTEIQWPQPEVIYGILGPGSLFVRNAVEYVLFHFFFCNSLYDGCIEDLRFYHLNPRRPGEHSSAFYTTKYSWLHGHEKCMYMSWNCSPIAFENDPFCLNKNVLRFCELFANAWVQFESCQASSLFRYELHLVHLIHKCLLGVTTVLPGNLPVKTKHNPR